MPIMRGFLFSELKTRAYNTRKKHMDALILVINSKTEKASAFLIYITEIHCAPRWQKPSAF
jgi:hypothetical protein